MRRWTALEPIAAASTIVLYGAWFNQWFRENRPVATVFAFAFYAQFSVSKCPNCGPYFGCPLRLR